MYTLITVDKQRSSSKNIIGTFDTLDDAKASLRRNDLNPFLSLIINCNKENQDSLIQEGLKILNSKNH